jgi:hypothetical protein
VLVILGWLWVGVRAWFHEGRITRVGIIYITCGHVNHVLNINELHEQGLRSSQPVRNNINMKVEIEAL